MLQFHTHPSIDIKPHHYPTKTLHRNKSLFDDVFSQLRLENEREIEQKLRLEKARQFRNAKQRQQQLQLERLRNEQQESKTSISVKHIESRNAYKIQIFKEDGDFSSYEIKLTQNKKHQYCLKLVSAFDNFSKVYELDNNSVQIDKIGYKWYEDENCLMVSIPKKDTVKSVEKQQLKETKRIAKAKRASDRAQRKQIRKLEKLEKLKRKAQAQEKREAAITNHKQSEFEDSSSSTTSDISESESSSEYEVLPNAPKMLHHPSIEEVEDEEFVLLRKKIGQ